MIGVSLRLAELLKAAPGDASEVLPGCLIEAEVSHSAPDRL